MGFDQYLRGKLTQIEYGDNAERMFGGRVSEITVDLIKWRNHWDLHNYLTKDDEESDNGGTIPCQIELSDIDIMRMCDDIRDDAFRHLPGDIEAFQDVLSWYQLHKDTPNYWVCLEYSAG